MKRFFVALVICLLVTSNAGAQSEYGITIGSSSFLGDLGGSRDIGRAFIYDLDLQSTRPAVGVLYRKNMGKRMAFRLNAYFSQVWGDDAYANTSITPADPAWSRKYRNLSFKSFIGELSGMLEYNILPFQGGSMRNRFTPYVLAGIGGFGFSPKTYYDGDQFNAAGWYSLQPLSTEGQGFAQFPEKQKYSTIAICFPMGLGLKYNVSKKFGLSLEVAHRWTTTDYIDDVSTSYIDPALFYANLPIEDATIAEALADRSSGLYPDKTSAGQQRGDPSDNDGYTFVGMLTLLYSVGSHGSNKMFFCPEL
jgi:opacity protein-like surface antigen